VQEVANEVGISKMCHEILTENLGENLRHIRWLTSKHRGVSKSVKAFLTMHTMMKTF